MQDNDPLPIRRALILLFTALIGVRAIYESTWSPTPWFGSFVPVASFYLAGLLIAMAMPGTVGGWRKHPGKLTACTLMLTLLAVEITYAAFAGAASPPEPEWPKLAGLAGIAATTGLSVSRLVGAIRRRENKMRLMTAGLTESLWIMNCRTGTTQLAETFGLTFGYRQGEIASNRTGLTALTHPDDLEGVTRSFQRACESTDETWQATYRMRRADGTYAVVNDRCRFERDKSGTAVQAYGGILDISRQVEMETRLRELNERLENKIAEGASELARVGFAVTHDLKSPLTSILGYADLAAERESVKNDPVAKRHLESVILNVERMQLFIAGIMEKPKTEGARDRPAAANPAMVFADLEHELAPRFAKVHGELRFDGDGACIAGDRETLHRIFQNLADNALKFRREGIPPVVTLQSRREGKVIRIRVEDNGTGIPPEAIGRIFDMHYRAHTHLGTEGHGVGLAGVKESVARLGGEIRAESTPGVGTRFEVTLPAA